MREKGDILYINSKPFVQREYKREAGRFFNGTISLGKGNGYRNCSDNMLGKCAQKLHRKEYHSEFAKTRIQSLRGHLYDVFERSLCFQSFAIDDHDVSVKRCYPIMNAMANRIDSDEIKVRHRFHANKILTVFESIVGCME